MGYRGAVPSEHSSDGKTHRGGHQDRQQSSSPCSSEPRGPTGIGRGSTTILMAQRPGARVPRPATGASRRSQKDRARKCRSRLEARGVSTWHLPPPWNSMFPRRTSQNVAKRSDRVANAPKPCAVGTLHPERAQRPPPAIHAPAVHRSSSLTRCSLAGSHAPPAIAAGDREKSAAQRTFSVTTTRDVESALRAFRAKQARGLAQARQGVRFLHRVVRRFRGAKPITRRLSL